MRLSISLSLWQVSGVQIQTLQAWVKTLGTLRSDEGDGNGNATQFCTCIMLFCTFLCRHCTTTTWKCLISRFVEDMDTRQRLSFSFSELRYSLQEFNSRNICQHLTNWTSWNKRDKVLGSATSLFKWRFHIAVPVVVALSSLILRWAPGGWVSTPLVYNTANAFVSSHFQIVGNYHLSFQQAV